MTDEPDARIESSYRQMEDTYSELVEGLELKPHLRPLLTDTIHVLVEAIELARDRLFRVKDLEQTTIGHYCSKFNELRDKVRELL